MDKWPRDRTQQLRQLFIDGKGDAAIARELGVSRMAVIGKRQRLGLKRDELPRTDPLGMVLARKRREAATRSPPVASKHSDGSDERC